jgi:hypothetical protein
MQSYNRASGYSNPFLLYLLTALLCLSMVINVYMWNRKNIFQLKYEQEEHMQDSYQQMECETMRDQLVECRLEQQKKDSLIRRKDSLIDHLDARRLPER